MNINDWSITMEFGGYISGMTLDKPGWRIAMRRDATYVYVKGRMLKAILPHSGNFIQCFAECVSGDLKNEVFIKKDLTKLSKYCILVGIGRLF